MRVAPVLLVSSLLVAACGGGSDSAEPPASSDTAVTTVPVTATTASETTVAATDSTDVTAAPTTAPPSTDPPSTDPPAQESVTVESPDGNLMLTVARADFDRVSPTIEILDPADWPPEVAGGANLPGVTLYDLLPDGATFDAPVSVTRRVDAASFPDLGPLDIPLITLLTYSDGEYELLDGLSAARLGDDIYVTGTTIHFSNLLTSSEGGLVHTIDEAELGVLDPRSVADVLAGVPGVAVDANPARPGTDVVLRALPSTLPLIAREQFERLGGGHQLELMAGDEIDAAPVDINQFEIPNYRDFSIGSMTARFRLSLAATPSAGQLLRDAIDDAYEDLDFEATLFLALVPDEMYEEALDEIDRWFDDLDDEVEATIDVFHQAFGPDPSSIRRRYLGLPALPTSYSGLSALFEGSLSDPRLVSIAPIDVSSDGFETQSGIQCYCEYSEAFFFFADDDLELVTDVLDQPNGLDDFWAFAAGNTDVVTTLVVTDSQTGDPLRFQVGPSEGPIGIDTAEFAKVP